jgi:xanthine dehydrogenase accessory factor
MKNLDLQVIEQALSWLDQRHCVWLCTVVATYGSAPRGPGSMLVALPTGCFCGSLSGGCVEEDFLERLGRNEFAGHNQIVRYGEGGFAPSLELPCGGVLDVLVERFEPNSPPIGLRLGSKTPAEIALAVMADIVRVSNGVVRDQL